MLTVLEAFKAIKETHLEAKRIIDAATNEAEKLKKEAEQKALSVYEKAYETNLSQAERKAMGIKRKAVKDAEHELEKFLLNAEDQAKGIEAKARKNFKKAVDSVLDTILQ